MSDKWIRASELNEYVYCRRAWWLRRVGGQATVNVRELAQGSRFHEEHGRIVQQATWTQRLAYVLIFITVSAILFSLLLSLGT